MRLLISGGGTGGHIYPALSLIKEIKKHNPDSEILYVGTKIGLESELVPREGISFKTISITGFKRKLSFENVKTIYRFIKGVRDVKKIIRTFRPDVVVGTGGYVCGPVVYAAAKMNIPTAIHEQNSVPGLTNKFLSKYVDKIAISFEESSSFFPKDKVVYTGNPRATEAANSALSERRISGHQRKTVLIVGGSRGARPINDAFLEALKEAKDSDYQFLYITGQIHYDKVMEEVKKQGNPDNVQIEPFLHNMPQKMASVDLIVTRAGATTLAEITALGLPSILIPSPYVTNNHQEKNARALSSKNAAILRLEREMNGRQLLEDIDNVLSKDENWQAMHQAAKKLGKPHAATECYQLLEELAKTRKNKK